MLHALPFTTFGEAAALGLKAHVYCPSCYTTRQMDPMADRLRDRVFAGIRFRCTNVRGTGETCSGPGSVTIRPADLLPVGGDVRLAFLWCDRCLPPWAINHIPIDHPPWIAVDWRAGDRFRCPGCRRAVGWHIHGPTWRPFQSDRKRGIDGQGTDEAGPSQPSDDVDTERRL
jgi:hypothetical protein